MVGKEPRCKHIQKIEQWTKYSARSDVLEQHDRSTGPHDTSQLGKCERRVFNGTEDEGCECCVERMVLEWQIFGAVRKWLDTCRLRFCTRDLQHLAAEFGG